MTPWLPGMLFIEQRTSSVSVQTCPMFADPTVDDKIYRTKEKAYTFTGGSYTETFQFSAQENVGDSESCPTSEMTDTTFDPEASYGTLETEVDTYSDEHTRADVLADLPAIDWDEWSDTGLSFGAIDPADLHAMLDGLSFILPPATFKGVGGVSPAGSGLGEMSAGRDDAELRFRLGTPLACTVLYQVGSQFLPLYEGEAEDEMTWGGTLSLVVTGEATLTIPVVEDYAKKIRIVGIKWHPWT